MLNEKAQKELKEHLSKKIYQTAEEIKEYVLEKYKIEYSTKGITKLIKKLGFVYKKTKQVPGKANTEAQKEFVEKKYPELKAGLGKEDKIYFMDGTHPQHNSMPAYGWILSGKTAEIKSNTGRSRININGVLSLDGMEVLVREDERINAQSTIKLFEEIEEKNIKAKKIYIIADNAKYYKNKLVTEYLARSKIEIIFLPPYSPNLNLIERLWKFFHKKICYNKYYEKFDDFKKTTLDFFDNIEKYRDELSKLITENFEIIGKNLSDS